MYRKDLPNKLGDRILSLTRFLVMYIQGRYIQSPRYVSCSYYLKGKSGENLNFRVGRVSGAESNGVGPTCLRQSVLEIFPFEKLSFGGLCHDVMRPRHTLRNVIACS